MAYGLVKHGVTVNGKENLRPQRLHNGRKTRIGNWEDLGLGRSNTGGGEDGDAED